MKPTKGSAKISSQEDGLIEGVLVDNWPIGLEATRDQLRKAQMWLERYRAALRLAGAEISQRNRGIIALTAFAYQASRVASPATLLKLALVQALETISAPVGAIVLFNAETRDLTLGIHAGLTPELIRVLTGQQIDTGATALMPHLVTGTGALLEAATTDDEAERQLLRAGQLSSLVSLPLQLGPRLLGAFLVGLAGEACFKPAELCFLMALSQETATALESLRLRDGLWHTAETLLGGEGFQAELQEIDQVALKIDPQTPFELPATPAPAAPPAPDDMEQLLAAMMDAEDEVQQQNADLQALNTIAEKLNSTLNLKEILQCTVDQTQAILQTDAAWLYLVEEGGTYLEMRAHTGLSQTYVRGMHRLKPGDGIEGQVALTNRVYLVESVANDPHAQKIWVDKEGLQALVAVPITRPERAGRSGPYVIGVLATGTQQGPHYHWGPRQIRLLGSIANQVALAIDNAQLYHQVQEDQVSLKAGNEVLRTINDMLLEKNVFLEGLVQEDLLPGLAEAGQVLQHLLQEPAQLTVDQKKDLATLHTLLSRLNKVVKETNAVSSVLDKEFNRTIKPEKQENQYTSLSRPPRLERSDGTRPLSRPVEAGKPAPAEPSTPPTPAAGPSPQVTRALTFEEAAAAGLIPAHILNRESERSAPSASPDAGK